MSYEIFILQRAQKELTKIEHNPYLHIVEAIRSLKENPRPSGCKKLTGRDGWRIRVGNYRVIFEINDSEKKIVVLHVGHRHDIYQ